MHTSHRISHISTSMEFSRPCLQVWVLDQCRSCQNRFYKLQRIMIKMVFAYMGREQLGQVNVPSAGASTAWSTFYSCLSAFKNLCDNSLIQPANRIPTSTHYEYLSIIYVHVLCLFVSLCYFDLFCVSVPPNASNNS